MDEQSLDRAQRPDPARDFAPGQSEAAPGQGQTAPVWSQADSLEAEDTAAARPDLFGRSEAPASGEQPAAPADASSGTADPAHPAAGYPNPSGAYPAASYPGGYQSAYPSAGYDSPAPGYQSFSAQPTYQPGAYSGYVYAPTGYQSAPGAAGLGQSGSTAPARGAIGRGTIAGLIVVSAFLSASLAAAGTFAVYSMNNHTTAATKSASTAPDAQVVSLTESQAIVRVASLVKPSVVTISVTGTSSAGFRSTQFSGSGSGFVVSANGLIATNNHVVMNASSLTVTLDDGRNFAATVVKTDATHDLALIKINATGLTPLTLGDSSAVQVGQLAIAVGSPLGEFTDTVTSGIVSGLDRSITVGDPTSTFTENLSGLIQTDAAINPGNSGGPLLDASGTVVGVVTASSSSAQEIGFAVPINRVKSLMTAAGA